MHVSERSHSLILSLYLSLSLSLSFSPSAHNAHVWTMIHVFKSLLILYKNRRSVESISHDWAQRRVEFGRAGERKFFINLYLVTVTLFVVVLSLFFQFFSIFFSMRERERERERVEEEGRERNNEMEIKTANQNLIDTFRCNLFPSSICKSDANCNNFHNGRGLAAPFYLMQEKKN